jgi:phage recombination protein Bet
VSDDQNYQRQQPGGLQAKMADMTTRLPVPQGFERSMWRVLTEVIFPSAKSAASIQLALAYCRERGLDIMKKPVNIVPVWSSTERREIETIWPSIGEAQITAARSKEWAGLDPPRYAEPVTQTFAGRRKGQSGWEDTNAEVTYPAWCEVTVYRLVGGQRHAFTERVYWTEAYGRQGGGTVPNAMWAKRPYGQLQKVAKAAALRAAFPEEAGSSPTDEEMHGLTVEEANLVQHEPPKPVPMQPSPPITPDHDPQTGEVNEKADADGIVTSIPRYEGETWQQWGARFIAAVRAQRTLEGVDELTTDNDARLDGMKADLPGMYERLDRSIEAHKVVILKKTAPREPT